MTALDIIVLVLLGGGAVFGFLRGFVQEVLSLIAWVLALAAVWLLHTQVTSWLVGPIGNESGAAVAAFALLVLIPFAIGRWIAKALGEKSRNSLLGPIDRVLGFGFGALKGLIAATLLFLLAALGYDTLFGGDAERPAWMTQSRTYPLLSATGLALSEFIDERRRGSDARAGETPPAEKERTGQWF